MDDTPLILVVGSINMDLVVRAPHMPSPGETILGENFATQPGGKGANQAVAAARLGGRVAMIGRVGNDAFGTTLREGLEAEGIDTQCLMTNETVASGVAMIVVDARGENSIVVASGANFSVTPDDLYGCEHLFEKASVVVLQLELPQPTVRAAIDLARRHSAKVILDPAPVPKRFCDELCDVDILSPNVGEAEALTGHRAVEERIDKLVATELISRGARSVVLKLGSRGSMVVMADGHFYRGKPFRVDVVDTTAAGDAFTGALAKGVAEGMPLREATRLANAAGALACTRLGAQQAMPEAYEVKMLMDDQKDLG